MVLFESVQLEAHARSDMTRHDPVATPEVIGDAIVEVEDDILLHFASLASLHSWSQKCSQSSPFFFSFIPPRFAVSSASWKSPQSVSMSVPQWSHSNTTFPRSL